MPVEINGLKVYTPKEAAAYLTTLAGRKVTVGDLRQLRIKGRIHGIRQGYNDTVYTEAQLRAADLEKYKAGRPKKKVS